MKVSFIRDDNVAVVNGHAIRINLSDMPEGVRAVQFTDGEGHIEFDDAPNEVIDDLTPFQPWIARWQSAKDEQDAPKVSTPEEIKEQQRRSINTQRDATINSGFTHDGTLWHCDPTFQAQIQGFILAYSTGVLPPSATVTIRSKANTNHQLGQSQIIALAAAMMQHVQGIYAASWAAKDAL